MLPDLAGVPEPPGNYGDFQISPTLETEHLQNYWPHGEDRGAEEAMHHDASTPAPISRPQLDDTQMALGHMTGGTVAANCAIGLVSGDEQLSIPDSLETIGHIQPRLTQSLRSSMRNDSERPDLKEVNSQFISPEDLRQGNQYPSSSRISRGIRSGNSSSCTSQEGDESQFPAAGAKDLCNKGSQNSTSTGEHGKHGALKSTAQEPQVVSVSDISSLQLELRDPDKRRKLVEALQMQGILEEFGFKKEASPALETKAEDIPQGVKPENCHLCTHEGCDKKFQRPCELK